MGILLSAVDTQWPGNLGQIVPALERFGYHRFWTTEHHSPSQSASPLLAAAIICSMTSRMRVGTAGVLLRYSSPAQIVEASRLIGLYYGDRFDLGIAGATVGQASIDPLLLDGRPVVSAGKYEERLRLLLGLLSKQQFETSDSKAVCLGPVGRSVPPVWICGSSLDSAKLAGHLGTFYSFHEYIGRQRRSDLRCSEPLELYRTTFKLTHPGLAPNANLTLFGACAGTEEQAWNQWYSFFGIGVSQQSSYTKETVPYPSFVGTPRLCKEQILSLAQEGGVNECVVQCVGSECSSVIRSYRLLREAIF